MTFLSEAIPYTGARVAANPKDRWVLTLANRILVITNDGSVFAHDIAGHTVGVPYQLDGGQRVAANPQDKWVLTLGNRILVITTDGSVFAHDIAGHTVGIPYQLDGGQRVAANPQDKWVLTLGDRILVITADGSVFAHDIAGHTVGIPYQLDGGQRVAANPQDKWVLALGNRILVITADGSVFAHDITGNTVGFAFQLNAPRVAANRQDHFVVALLNSVLVITDDGYVFGHAMDENAPIYISFIYYDEPLTFGEYQDPSKGIDDRGLFTSFRIKEVENLSKSAPLFTFDPSNVQILNFPPLPDGPNGQPPSSARQMPYATLPAVSISVAPGTSSGNTFIGSYVFRDQSRLHRRGWEYAIPLDLQQLTLRPYRFYAATAFCRSSSPGHGWGG